MGQSKERVAWKTLQNPCERRDGFSFAFALGECFKQRALRPVKTACFIIKQIQGGQIGAEILI